MRRMWAAALTLACALTCALAGLTAATAAADGGLTRDRWWQRLTGEKTINARFYGLTLDEVRDDLDQIAADGYKILNLDWPVQAGPTSIYNGLSASDYYHVEPSIGTDQDWLDLLAAAHARGIAVTTWFNIAYFWTGSALFKQAEADVRRYGPVRANQPANSPARFFRWRSGAGSVTKPCDLCGVNGLTKRWVTDPDAGTNVSYYSGWADQPTGDFAASEWRAEARRVLEHWLDTGLDGFIVDAITEMVDCDASCLRSTITDTIHAYPGRMAAAETPRDATAIGYGFDATTDQAFWGDQIATSAIARQNPSALDDGLWTRDGIVAAGGTALSAPDLTRTSDAATHLLQAATIAASGNQLLIWDPGDGFGSPSTWAGEGASFKVITDAVVNNPALQSQGARDEVATDDATKTYAFVRTSPDATQKALAVFNYTNAARTVTVNLGSSGVADGATTNLLAGGAGPTISGASVSVRLPAWGYAFYGVPLTSSSCATNLCGTFTTAGAATVNLTSEGTADWAHWGTSSATSFDHKSGSNLISDRSAIGSGTITRYTNNAIGYTWTGGTPTASATASTTGIYVTGVGNGFSFTVPADTTARRVIVRVGAWEARGRLVATLSDGSASSYTSTALSAGSGSGANGVYTLAYRAARAGQTLTVRWTADSVVTVNGNVTLQSAALQGGGGGGPTTTVVDDAAAGWSWGGGWSAYADAPAYGGTAHGGGTVGGYGSYTFTGSAVRVRTWKESGAGSVEVFLDGVSQGTYSLDNRGAEAYGQLLFSHSFGSSGTHTIRVVATTTAWTMVDALEVDS